MIAQIPTSLLRQETFPGSILSMKPSQIHAIVVAVLTGTVFLTPALQARTCSGNGDVIGSYAFYGSRGGFFLLGATAPGATSATGVTPIGVTPPGTTSISGPLIPIGVTAPGTTSAQSTQFGTTPWSRFIANLAGNAAFSSVGRIFADGMGNLYASDATAVLLTNTLVGTYVVNPECSITMSIRDPFPATLGGAVTTTGGPTITLEGEIIGGRIEAVATNPNAAGATITFIKTSQFNACSNASLLGNFGIVGSGVIVPGAVLPPNTTLLGGASTTGGAFSSGATTTLGTAFNLLGRLNADGTGIFTPDTTLLPSPLKRTLTGTYTVNVDCTGTAHLVDATTGLTRNISFVLVNDASQCVSTTSTSSAQQSLRFVFSDPGVIGSGSATLQ
jgi:hypothetical protein